MNLQDSGTRAGAEALWQRLPTTWRLMVERGGPQAAAGRGVLALIEAAAAQPELRRLYPFTSRCVLRFGSRGGVPTEADAPALEPTRDGRFRVLSPSLQRVLGEADSAEEAVALAVARLPSPSA
ncbi:hypothetical protein SUDANB120_01970 [Streptomyces sp. enrichment culture]|uniref:DUF6193 family natural product biosynthesis protein n=1 Tax=Streptomyces TaxID=1883 RepID=UPI001671B17C|nr:MULTISPECIES: DUF6193 family natural product biosynthesis protein [Streptomyces]MBD3578451.1 hypothetical protein [Streptomyces sp. KD18]GGT11399.1 hypothetical protein GCM10010286_41420 [Streptomyces toxytricini]